MSNVTSIGYFEERFDNEQRWLDTCLKFHTPPIPFYQVYTGGQHQRFMLATPKFKCHWGRIFPYLQGVRLLRNPIDIAAKDMPIASISSADIEQFKEQNPDHPLQYWASFFADKLLHSSRHFLYPSDWKISPMVYQVSFEYSDFQTDVLALDMKQLDYHFDWGGFPDSNIISLKILPDEHCGRVKWWRKKIREQSCPPLLLWWHRHIQAFVLVDGHARLKAHQLEQVQPAQLVVYSFQSIGMTKKEAQGRIQLRLKALKSLKKSLGGNKPYSLERVNKLIIGFYSNVDYEYTDLTPKVIAHLDDVFEQDLLAFVDDERVDQDFLQLLLAE